MTIAGNDILAAKHVVPATPQVDKAKRDAVQAGIKAVKEGRTIPHEKVKAWLESLGTDEEMPPPQCK